LLLAEVAVDRQVLVLDLVLAAVLVVLELAQG
jgi:hypothetical protein